MKLRLFAAAAAIMLLLPSCGAGETEAPPLADSIQVVYDTAKVERGDVAATLVFSAYVLPARLDVGFEDVSGTVSEVLVKSGDRVSEGDALLRLDTSALSEWLEEAEARLESLKASGERERRLFEIDLELAELARDEAAEKDPESEETALAELEVRRCRINLENYGEEFERSLRSSEEEAEELRREIEKSTLRAPASGEVISVYAAEGSRVASSTTLVTVSDGDRRYISCSASEKIPNSAELSFILDGTEYPLERWEYTEREIAVFEAEGRDIPHRFVRADGGELPAVGTFVQVRAVRERSEDTLRIPAGALYRDAGVTYVYVEADGELIYTEVKTGAVSDAYVEITDGLEEGDEVYVGG